MQLIRSKRKSISIEIKKDLSVLVRAPISMDDRKISEFVELKKKWIDKHIELMKLRNMDSTYIEKLTDKEILDLTIKARELIPKRVEYFTQIIKVNYGRITIRNQKSRWGSCSSKGNLSFNCLLMLTQAEVIDYVIVHELCHRKEMNHSVRFWNEVKKVMPNYEIQRKWLRDNGNKFIDRLEQN